MTQGFAVLALALAAPAEPPATDEPAPVAAPEPAGIEVVRVERDFGKPHFDLAIDAWTDGKATRLEKARLWWVNTSLQDRRKPLGALIERMVKLQYARVSNTSLTVTVSGDGKQFAFTVELGQDGKLHAYVPVDTDDGKHIPRCRTDSARLIAHRVLGLPVGLARIAVTCSDGSGSIHHGQVRHRDG